MKFENGRIFSDTFGYVKIMFTWIDFFEISRNTIISILISTTTSAIFRKFCFAHVVSRNTEYKKLRQFAKLRISRNWSPTGSLRPSFAHLAGQAAQ
jgi:hypothetical protein